MKLVPKQARFALALADIILRADILGYAVTIGEVQRSEAQALQYFTEGKGILESCHIYKLAVDLCLFDGTTFEEAPEKAYQELASDWLSEPYGPDRRCWGGNFSRKDIYHFSFEHNGKQ